MVRNAKKEGNVLPVSIIVLALVMVSFLPANAANAPQGVSTTMTAGAFLGGVHSSTLLTGDFSEHELLGTVSHSSGAWS